MCNSATTLSFSTYILIIRAIHEHAFTYTTSVIKANLKIKNGLVYSNVKYKSVKPNFFNVESFLQHNLNAIYAHENAI